MFGLSWAQIGIIVLVGAFVLGPERIPTAVTFVTGSVRKVRSMAAGAQAGLRSEIGPELDELRRQIAELQSLKEIQELRDLRDLHPKNLLGKHLLGPAVPAGVAGSGPPPSSASSAIEALTAQAAIIRAPDRTGAALPDEPMRDEPSTANGCSGIATDVPGPGSPSQQHSASQKPDQEPVGISPTVTPPAACTESLSTHPPTTLTGCVSTNPS